MGGVMLPDKREPDAPLSTLQIGMTAASSHMSGTDRYFLELLRSLPASGVAVHGILLGDPADVDDPVAGVEGFARTNASRLRRWLGIRRSVGRLVGSSDVVVSHGVPHIFPAIDLVQSRPLVVHFHGDWAAEARMSGRHPATVHIRHFQQRTVFAHADRFIVLSRAFASALTAGFGVSPEMIDVIPGGVDLDLFDADESQHEARAACGLPDRPIVLCVSRLVAAKGLSALISAMTIVHPQHPNAFLAIVGSGPLAADLQRQIDGSGLHDSVQIVGHVGAGLPLFYRAANVTIVPSDLVEGFGLVVVESLAMGTPVLVTPVGGLPEVISDLDRQLILDSPTVKDLAAGLCRALNNPSELPRGPSCRDYATRFAWSTIAGRVAAAYRDVRSMHVARRGR
jgi:glycosyltransferase involved in cell wall biosynthesis